MASRPQVSVILPCLDEAVTVAGCVAEARRALARLKLSGEVLVVDNGSRDGSGRAAQAAGARVLRVRRKGYGSALRGGMDATRGRYLVMADSDGSYDFSELGRFVEKMRGGYEMVVGNRFRGRIRPGAMPWMNRFIGNPALTAAGRILFYLPLGDLCCGFRGLTREAYRSLDLRTDGMEFAAEMIVRGAAKGLRLGEVPVTLRPDGRGRPSHLRIWRDGWRTLRWMAQARLVSGHP